MEYNDLKFDDDLLNRKSLVVNIMNVIENWDQFNYESKSLVLSVDAPWGSGKSYLLNMWKNWLISQENSSKSYAVTYYNAWENDDSDNAFIPLVYKLQHLDSFDNELMETVKSKTKSFIKSCSIALLKDGIKKIIGEETAELVGAGIDGAKEEKVENFFETYKKYIMEKEKFSQALSDLVPEDGKLIVFIDELDRCRPYFAIETLEIVKHYCNIQNIVFIFAVDLKQLSHSVSTMYGENMDSAGYLRRFFDININIPTGDIKQYVEIIFKEFLGKLPHLTELKNVISNLYKELNLSLRDINKITNNFIVFYLFYKDTFERRMFTSEDLIHKMEIYLYFIILKYKYPDIYDIILNQKFIVYDNKPKDNYTAVLVIKYFPSQKINEMLRGIQTGGAVMVGIGKELIAKYGLEEINSEGSFSEHIQRTIEMFV